MQESLQITFLHTPPSAALEAAIADKAADLEALFDRITSCRVFVEAPAARHRKGGLYQVRVELHVPGHHLAGRSDQHAQHVDPYAAVGDAFRTVRRQLEDHVHRTRSEAKNPAA
jgi:ribosome-associated translation inhibitor RaiA